MTDGLLVPKSQSVTRASPRIRVWRVRGRRLEPGLSDEPGNERKKQAVVNFSRRRMRRKRRDGGLDAKGRRQIGEPAGSSLHLVVEGGEGRRAPHADDGSHNGVRDISGGCGRGHDRR